MVEVYDHFYYECETNKTIITIPKGFRSDFATIPDCLTWFIHPNDKRIREAALVHDYLWDNRHEFQDEFKMTPNELKFWSNREFEIKCRTLGMSRWKSWVIKVILNYHPIAKKYFYE
jgi:hypothetical protein